MATAEQSVTWASRTERSDGKTSPEELIAAAHASCLAMALSNVLDQGGTPPERLHISAVCTFDIDNVKVSSVDLDIRGRVSGLDAEGFQSAVEQADAWTPSRWCAFESEAALWLTPHPDWRSPGSRRCPSRRWTPGTPHSPLLEAK